MRTIDTLPGYLKQYCIEHDYNKYTARDQAAWRYIMRRANVFFNKYAVTGYEQGLKATGISIDKIPHIDDIDAKMQAFGWGAVPVCGFIPPWAFLEFQAKKILPIATDMRTADHIAYTPAPDIVHEAAGHAPILPDMDYNAYLSHYASLGCKAIYSREDLNLYEAIRYLSDIKEKPESTKEQIADAEQQLVQATRSISYVSEAAKVGRMSWWTAEYGLAGNLNEPKIFGAGLLSSVGESQMAMTAKVKKIPLSLKCTEYSYNITEPQPQLFVAENMQHLHEVLNELDTTLSYRIGGTYALEKALESKAVTTTILDSGVGISGILESFEMARGKPAFIKYNNAVQLSSNETQLSGQGPDRHAHGFSSPIGRWKATPDRPPYMLTDYELKNRIGLILNQPSKFSFLSGVTVTGIPTKFHRSKKGHLQYISFNNCTVKWGDKLLFDPSWGEFDMVVGDQIESVYGGPADRESYGEREIIETSSTPGRESPYSVEEKSLFGLYQKIIDLREASSDKSQIEQLEEIYQIARKKHPSEWLLCLNIYEYAIEDLSCDPRDHHWLAELESLLANADNWQKSDHSELVKAGLAIMKTPFFQEQTA